jgi:hypothetical protein
MDVPSRHPGLFYPLCNTIAGSRVRDIKVESLPEGGPGMCDTEVDADAIHQQSGLAPSVCVRKDGGAAWRVAWLHCHGPRQPGGTRPVGVTQADLSFLIRPNLPEGHIWTALPVPAGRDVIDRNPEGRSIGSKRENAVCWTKGWRFLVTWLTMNGIRKSEIEIPDDTSVDSSR